MKCTSCGAELRIAPEQIGVDSNNVPVYHRFGYCDKCKYKWDLDMNTQQAKKKHSKLSCIACAFAGIAVIMPIIFIIGLIMSFVGMVIGVIDLCMHDDKTIHMGSWFAIIVYALYMFFLIF